MRIAERIIEKLAAAGIDTAFLVYGGAISDLVDALPGRMKHVVCQHEQAAGFAAEGYAKAGGRLGCAIATSGPGGGNLVTPIQNCFYDSTPVVFITGQVASAFRRPEGSRLRQLGFQETPITEIVAPITKFCTVVDKPHYVDIDVEDAIRIATEGRPGPVLLDIPNDIQRMELPDQYTSVIHPEPMKPIDGRRFMDDLANARRPGILVGGGAYKAREKILAFAERHSIPVFRTWNAQDVCTDDHPCYAGTVGTYGGPGRNFGIQQTDLLLVLGCRLSGRITGAVPKSFAREAKLYVVDVDEALLEPQNQPRRADVNVLCDAGRFVEALI